MELRTSGSEVTWLLFNMIFLVGFLAHLSWRLKWAIVIARRPSVVVVVRPLTFHIFDFFSRTAWWILMKLGRYEVLMVPYKCCCFSTRSAQGRIQGGAKIGHGGSPSFRNFFFRPEGYSDKPNAYQWSRSMWEEVLLFLVPFRSQIFDAFLTSFWTLPYFNAISMDFYAAKCLIRAPQHAGAL